MKGNITLAWPKAKSALHNSCYKFQNQELHTFLSGQEEEMGERESWGGHVAHISKTYDPALSFHSFIFKSVHS